MTTLLAFTKFLRPAILWNFYDRLCQHTEGHKNCNSVIMLGIFLSFLSNKSYAFFFRAIFKWLSIKTDLKFFLEGAGPGYLFKKCYPLNGVFWQSRYLSITSNINLFYATGLFLYSVKTLRILIFSEGIERDQWHENG